MSAVLMVPHPDVAPAVRGILADVERSRLGTTAPSLESLRAESEATDCSRAPITTVGQAWSRSDDGFASYGAEPAGGASCG